MRHGAWNPKRERQYVHIKGRSKMTEADLERALPR